MADDAAADRARTGRAVVLHVCTRFQRGGSERRVEDAIRATPDLEHHLVVGRDSDLELARGTGADRVELMPALVRSVHVGRDLRTLAALRRRLRAGRYALVVTHQSKAGALGRAAAAASGVPAVHSLSMASFGAGYGRLENLLFRRLERVLGRRTAAFCAVGADLAGRVAGLGVPADRFAVVRSGVPLPRRLNGRAEARRLLVERYEVAPERPLIGYVGSLEPRKNPVLLAELLRHLHDRLPEPPDLVVVGDGPQRDELLDAVCRLGLDGHATFTGHLTDPALVHDVVRGVDVVVLLSSVEGLPQVLVQAAATGTPFVAFDVEGVRELIALGAAGDAVPPGRTDVAAEAVARRLAKGADDVPTADLASWSPEAIADGYRTVLHEVLAGVRPARS